MAKPLLIKELEKKVIRTGDAMTGPLTLQTSPLEDLHAVTKQYVDDASVQDFNNATDYADTTLGEHNTAETAHADIREAIPDSPEDVGAAPEIHDHNYVVEMNDENEQRFWSGTREEYDNLESIDENTMYLVSDDSFGTTVVTAEEIQYSGLLTGLSADNIQDAIDESYLTLKEYTDKEIDKIPILVNVSELQNDVGYLSQEIDPTVPVWAKAETKPTYNYDEVGADAAGTAENLISVHNTAVETHKDIRLLIEGLDNRLTTLANSDDTTLDQMKEVVDYIKDNRELIDAITTDKVNVSDIINNLETNADKKPLSAAQGVVLKGLIDAIKIPTKVSELTNDSKYLVDSAIYGWAKAATKPAYNAAEVGAVALEQGASNSGKILGVGSNGKVALVDNQKFVIWNTATSSTAPAVVNGAILLKISG